MTAPIRVLIVDDDAMVRSGLTMMLSGAPQIEVVGEASDGRGVLPAVDLHNPDVVLMDIRMPRLDGIAATRLLSAQPHPPAVLVLTTFDADELVLRALQAGAAGFLLKDSPPADIVRAIDSVHAGDGTLSPRITRRLIDLVAGDPDVATSREQARQRLAALTPREREVAAAVADGSSNAEIATRLHMSLATVKAHVSRLLVKLDAANRVQIALLVQDAASRPRLSMTPDQRRRNGRSVSHLDAPHRCHRRANTRGYAVVPGRCNRLRLPPVSTGPAAWLQHGIRGRRCTLLTHRRWRGLASAESKPRPSDLLAGGRPSPVRRA